MKVKITVHVDESLKRLIKESSGNKKISDVVSEALESHVAAGSVNNMNLPGAALAPELSSLSR